MVFSAGGQLTRRQIQDFGETSVVRKLAGRVVAVLVLNGLQAVKICQISFLCLSTPVERPYGSPGLGSKYQGQQEPTPSRIRQDFND
jgi:hypothetical protein